MIRETIFFQHKRWLRAVLSTCRFYFPQLFSVAFDELTLSNPFSRKFWDFGGQLRFIDQMKSMIRGASVGLLFFDVTRLQTLDSLEGYWIPAIEENSALKLQEGDGPRFMIVANKVDLLDEERYDFIADEMRYVMDKYKMGGQMISARTGIGLERLDEGFMAIVDKFTPD